MQGGQSGLLDLVGLTRNGQSRALLVETSLWKCRSKRRLIGLLLTDMLVLLERRGAEKYSLYRPVRPAVTLYWFSTDPMSECTYI